MKSKNNKGGFILRKNAGEMGLGTIATPPRPPAVGAIGMRQLFDSESSTYTYLLWDKETEDAILVDPVVDEYKRDLMVTTLLNLVYCVNTHVHADHISGSGKLKTKVKQQGKGDDNVLKSVISTASKAEADERIGHLDEIHFGNRYITAIATPGHTQGCLSFVLDDKTAVLTGDALLIGGCGRTDLQGGSAETLYDSVHDHLFATLPDNCIVFPGHDYEYDLKERTHSTIGEEKATNPRLGRGISKEEFVNIMSEVNRNLSRPKQMDITVPANMEDGAKPFFVRSLRTRVKQRWGLFG